MDLWSVILCITAATADLILGSLWYHPHVFGAHWVRAMNLSPQMAEHGRRHKHLFILIAFLASILTAATLRFVEHLAGVSNPIQALTIGALMAAGFMLPVLIGQLLWDQKPWALFLMNTGFWFISCLMMAAIVSL